VIGVERILRRGAALGLAAAFALGPLATRVLAATTAGPDAFVMNENGTLVVDAPGVLANDEGDGGAGICVAGYSYPSTEGTVTAWGTDGSFTFTPWEHWTGETSFVYGMKVGDGQCIGQADAQAIVTVTVRPVNDPPTAVIAGSCAAGVTVGEDSGPYGDPSHCVENHNLGQSLDELTQLVEEWVVTNDAHELFSEQPHIAIDSSQVTFGTLHFTPARDAHGTATVTVRSRDNGGTARGGDDLSPPISFTITITAKADPAPVPPTEEPPFATAEPVPSASADPPSEAPSLAPAETPVEGTGSPTSFADGVPVLIVVLLIVGILAIGAGILAPRLVRRSREP
jgi:hypothetical protein